MTIVDIYHLEQGNTDCIYLYKEGLFWKAYEISAWLFTLLIRPYKINVRKYKAIDDPVVSLGFPETVLATLLDGHQVLNRTDLSICLQVGLPETTIGYSGWKENCLDKMKRNKSGDSGSFADTLIEEISRFPLATSTPMECLRFVSALKDRITNKIQTTDGALS